MSAFSGGSRSLAPLGGELLVRFVYVDEAGISAKEPHAVVAGIVVHADNEWKLLEASLRGLVSKYVPGADPSKFIFHAKDLFHGEKLFPRDKWPKELRWEILERLVSLPREFGMPIVLGSWGKADVPAQPKTANVQIDAHAMAFAMCVSCANAFVRVRAPNEVAIVVAENNQQARSSLKELQARLRERVHDAFTELAFKNLTFTHIVDTLHFAEKSESALLQVADACAFTARRYFCKLSNGERFFNAMRGHCVKNDPILEKKVLQEVMHTEGTLLSAKYRDAMAKVDLWQRLG
jgi:hypothetical protein